LQSVGLLVANLTYDSGRAVTDRVVLLLDHPSEQTTGGVTHFKRTYSHLENNRQIYILDKRDIEQCYPNYSCSIYNNWQKTQDETNRMSSKQKCQLAKYVGENITQEQFESSLVICFKALNRVWELAF
jgi:putative ATP-dependent endonuclease of OLD family